MMTIDDVAKRQRRRRRRDDDDDDDDDNGTDVDTWFTVVRVDNIGEVTA